MADAVASAMDMVTTTEPYDSCEHLITMLGTFACVSETAWRMIERSLVDENFPFALQSYVYRMLASWGLEHEPESREPRYVT